MRARMCPWNDEGEHTCPDFHGGVCLDCGFVTRDSQEVDVLYVNRHNGQAFVTTDGEGRYYFDSLEEAEEEHGDDFADVLDVDGWSD